MLYKFKSKSTGDVIMLQPNGQRVLEIIGKDTHKGIILPEHMAAAMAALEAAIGHEESAQQAAVAAALARHEPVPRVEGISLRQRALPLMDMLRRSQQDGHEVVWGV